MAKEKIKTDTLRSPFYELGDKIVCLGNATYDLKDEKLRALVKQLQEQRDEIYKYLNENYIWD